MTVELVSSADVIKTAEDAVAEEAAFRGVFTSDVQPEKVEEPVAATQETEEKPADEAPLETPAEPEPAKSYTIDDLRAMIEETTEKSKQQISKLGGKLGELQQKIEAARNTVSGISPKAKDRLMTDFPELATMLFDDEPAEIVKQPEMQTSETKEVEFNEEALQEAQDLLTLDHPDWATVVQTPEFNSWVATLPPTIAKRLNETYDPAFVSDKLTRFKTYQAQQVKPAPQKKDTSKLDAAVTPRGVPRNTAVGNVPDNEEEAAFKAAFKPKFTR